MGDMTISMLWALWFPEKYKADRLGQEGLITGFNLNDYAVGCGGDVVEVSDSPVNCTN